MAEPTPLRRTQLSESPADRILALQKALEAEISLLEQKIVDTLTAASQACQQASEQVTKVGVSQELAKLAMVIKESVDRLQAMRMRG